MNFIEAYQLACCVNTRHAHIESECFRPSSFTSWLKISVYAQKSQNVGVTVHVNMDLRRMKNEDKLELCRKYYLGGFALLPFLWCINFVWFFKEAFRKPSFDEQKQIRTYVIRSLIGMLLWTTVIVTWVVIFQLNRADWGATADYMSFIIPKGIP